MKLRVSIFSALATAALVVVTFSAAPNTASAQGFETDNAFERRALSEINSVRRRLEKFREELTGDAPDEPGRRSTGSYPGIVGRILGLEKRCDQQEEYVRRMLPSSMRSDYEVQRERRAILDDIRNVRMEIGRLKKSMKKIDEGAEKADQEKAEREALEEEIMQEEW